MRISERELLEATKKSVAGDWKSFLFLCDAYYPCILKQLNSIHNQTEHEQLMEEAYYALYKELKHFREQAWLSSYFTLVLQKFITQKINKNNRKKFRYHWLKSFFLKQADKSSLKPTKKISLEGLENIYDKSHLSEQQKIKILEFVYTKDWTAHFFKNSLIVLAVCTLIFGFSISMKESLDRRNSWISTFPEKSKEIYRRWKDRPF